MVAVGGVDDGCGCLILMGRSMASVGEICGIEYGTYIGALRRFLRMYSKMSIYRSPLSNEFLEKVTRL